jgi:hypothetical protein
MKLRLFSGGLWNQIRILADGCARRVAAVAYLTTEQSVRFNNGDLLIVDASDEAIKAGATSARVLAALRTRGVDLYSLAGLHAKVMVFDETAVVGSANLTANSTKLVESAIVTDSPALVASAVALIESLRIHKKTRRIDKAFIDYALSLPVLKPPTTPHGSTIAPPVKQPDTWLVGIHALDDEKYAAEAADAANGTKKAAALANVAIKSLSWVRYPRSSRLAKEATVGDVFIQCWRHDKDGDPTHAYRGTAVLHRQDEARCVRFYVRDQGNDERVTWHKFLKQWAAIGMKAPPGRDAERVISPARAVALDALWG